MLSFYPKKLFLTNSLVTPILQIGNMNNSNVLKLLINNQFLVALIVVTSIWFLIELREILIILFISFILTSTLSIFVDFLEKRRFPKILAVLIPYVTTVSVIAMLIIPLVPFFTSQLQMLFASFPIYLNQAAKLLNISIDSSEINKILPIDPNSIGKNALLFTGKLFNGVFSSLAILVISFYFMLGRGKINRAVVALFPKGSEHKVLSVIDQMERKLGAWFRGQLLLSFSIGLATWIGLSALGIPSALPLALLAGILEIVPTIGPIISSIPAIIIALTISPAIAGIVVALYILIQMAENNFLVPKIMERAVGLNPIVIIVGVMIGAKLIGVLGALLSVPFIAIIVILLKNLNTPKAK